MIESRFESVLEEKVLVQNNSDKVVRYFKLTRRQAFLLRVKGDVGAWRVKEIRLNDISAASAMFLTPFG